eukprot:gene696-857_t
MHSNNSNNNQLFLPPIIQRIVIDNFIVKEQYLYETDEGYNQQNLLSVSLVSKFWFKIISNEITFLYVKNIERDFKRLDLEKTIFNPSNLVSIKIDKIPILHHSLDSMNSFLSGINTQSLNIKNLEIRNGFSQPLVFNTLEKLSLKIYPKISGDLGVANLSNWPNLKDLNYKLYSTYFLTDLQQQIANNQNITSYRILVDHFSIECFHQKKGSFPHLHTFVVNSTLEYETKQEFIDFCNLLARNTSIKTFGLGHVNALGTSYTDLTPFAVVLKNNISITDLQLNGYGVRDEHTILFSAFSENFSIKTLRLKSFKLLYMNSSFLKLGKCSIRKKDRNLRY